MAQKNSWSFQNPEDLYKKGMLALSSGAISPEDAAAHAQEAGLDIGGIGDQTDNPMAMGQLGKGEKASQEKNDSTTFKRSSTRNFTKDPSQNRAEIMMAQGETPSISGYQPAMDEAGNPIFDRAGKQVMDQDHPNYDFEHTTVDPNHPVQQQIAGVNRMEDLLRMKASADQGRSATDLSPLAALADAWSKKPSNLAGSVKPQEDTTGKFMAYADEIQKRKGDIQKAISENQKNLKGGSTMDQLVQAIALKDSNSQGNQVFDRAQALQDRLDNTNHQNVLRSVKRDPVLVGKLTQYQNLGSALNNFANADTGNPQSFDELQQAIRANLGIKGNTDMGARNRTMLGSLGINADRIQQFITGDPVALSKDDKLVAHIKNLAGLEASNINQQFSARLRAAAGGNASMYARRPDLDSDLKTFLLDNQAQLTPPATPKHKGGGSGKSYPVIPSVSDIDAEIARRGGK